MFRCRNAGMCSLLARTLKLAWLVGQKKSIDRFISDVYLAGVDEIGACYGFFVWTLSIDWFVFMCQRKVCALWSRLDHVQQAPVVSVDYLSVCVVCR